MKLSNLSDKLGALSLVVVLLTAGVFIATRSAKEKPQQQRKLSLYDPRTVDVKSFFDLSYQVNPFTLPTGYPWHRWSAPEENVYPLNTEKFVSVLSRLGRGEKFKISLSEGLQNLADGDDFVRLSGDSRAYIVRDGQVLRPHGNDPQWQIYEWNSAGLHIDFATLLEDAVKMATSITAIEPRMKLISEGDFPIIYDTFDAPWCGDDLVPIFRLNSFSKITECRHSWPVLSLPYAVPDRVSWLRDTPYDWDTQFDRWESDYPWNSKIKKAVWRNRPVGYPEMYDGVLPRDALGNKAEGNFHLMDVQLIPWGNLDDSSEGTFRASRNAIDPEDFMKYRAVIVIDENGANTQFGKLMCMNSIVIKVDSKFSNYWEDELQPWIHYVPVKSDFSDLKMRVKWAVDDSNQKNVGGIISSANKWCRKQMIWKKHVKDFMWTLLAYAETLQNSPEFYHTWKSDNYAYMMPNAEMAIFERESVQTK